MKKRTPMQVAAAIAVLVIISTFNAFGQSLPLTGGTLSGTAIGPNFIQKGSMADLAATGTLTTNGNNFGGGALYRSSQSYTSLTTSQYMTVDIGSTSLTVNVISFGTNWSSDARYIPAGYTIDYSNDNSSWTNFATVTGNTNLNPSYTLSIAARYWRLTITALQSGQSICSISGFQLISTVAGSTGLDYWVSPINSAGIFTNSLVGIGVLNPSAKLHVDGSGLFSGNVTAASLVSGSSANGSNIFQQVAVSNYNGISGVSYPGQFRWYTSPNNSLYKDAALYQLRSYDLGSTTEDTLISFKGNGHVGIGTTNPDELLSVKGIIHSQEVKVDLTGWSDYVLKPAYKLPALSAVKTYIDQNHHLPEIPTEEEIVKNGLNVGEMNKLLMKKVEELTLYLIEKDRQVDEQKAVNQQQSASIQAMRSQLNQIKRQIAVKAAKH
ncbi:discoidin domain-containing protein [Mucilaginibacter mali]|uniref:Discoidin domain-containing protein n=1 Tax=Mucilaginibacter mali TaxID=2740462 RepID=A0A7D4U9F2_9SPHI|nr:discoidin domain-containing protein [Mucilaginibacter mali]QKJ28998.1 discoidin domain-containing protein [Mucilaginibacter mali]